MNYAVELIGSEIDLADLRRIFGATGPIQVVAIDVMHGGKATSLQAEEFNLLSSGVQVLESSKRLVSQMNGMLFVADPDRSVVRPGAVYSREDDGQWSAGTIYASGTANARSRARGNLTATYADGTNVPASPSLPKPATWIARASSDHPNAARVADLLNALSGEPDWFDLWRAQEIYHWEQKNLPNWPVIEFERIRATATLYRHSPTSREGKKARKWFDDHHLPKATLEEARTLVAGQALRWLDLQIVSS